MKKNDRLYSAVLMLVLGIALYLSVAHLIQERHICFIRNASESLPFSYFFGYKLEEEPKRGMYVSFEHPKSDILLVKRIAGLPGDCISIRDMQIFINEVPYGHIQSNSPSGMLLSPIEAGEIPKGYVYVTGLHPSSFDSRYAEFGLVPISQLKKQLWPLY